MKINDDDDDDDKCTRFNFSPQGRLNRFRFD